MKGPSGSKEKVRKRAEADFHWFCLNVMQNDGFDTEFHERMCKFLQGSCVSPKRVSVMIEPRGHTKCLPPCQEVQVASGEYVRVGDLAKGDLVWGMSDAYESRIVRVEDVWMNGVVECVTVRFRSGREVKASTNHPFRRLLEWTQASDLKAGDRVAVIESCPQPSGAVHLPWAGLLGWMLGDGCFPLQRITNSNPVLRQAIISDAAKAGAAWRENDRGKRAADVSLRGMRPLWRSLGLMECRAPQKFIPPIVFTADDESVAGLLRGLFASDATWGHTGISLCTVSKRLATDVQRLLRRLRINSRIWKRKTEDVWLVIVSSEPMTTRFVERVGWLKPRNSMYREPVGPSNPNHDTIPAEWRRLTTSRQRTILYDNGVRVDNAYATSKAKIGRAAAILNNAMLQNLAKDSVFWDEVVAVEPSGQTYTIDMQVEGGNFAVSDVVTHNTTAGSVYLPPWELIQNPNETIQIVHGINATAERIISQIREILETNGLFFWLWPHIFFKDPTKEARDWKAESITVKRNIIDKASSIQVNGITGTQAGLHFSRITGDDLVNDQNYKTPGQLEATIECIKDQQNLLKGETAKYRFYGTIWNYNDASGWLLNTPEFKGKIRSLIQSVYGGYSEDGETKREDDGTPVWPKVRSAAFLDEQRLIMGTTKFAQQYLCQRIPDGTAVFLEKDIKRYDQEWDGDRLILPGEWSEEEPRAYTKFVSVDTNTRESSAYDAAVILTGALDDSGDLWIVDIKRWWPSAGDLLVECRKAVLRWTPMKFLYEVVGAQKKDIYWIQRDAIESGVHYPLQEVNRPPVRKFDRICPILQPLCERGGIHIPRGGKFDTVVDEMRGYSAAATQDDILDCMTDIVQFGIKPLRPEKRSKSPQSQWLIDQMLDRAQKSWTPAKPGLMHVGWEGAIY